MTEAPKLEKQDWLESAETQAVLALLKIGGHEARVVGGAVRNALMELPVTDVDIATTARPEEVVALARAAGLGSVETGLSHGTVTVIANKVAFEVTTLRRDVATDGRRAKVVFTDAWHEDAARRDFSINAIYCAADGTLYDPQDGIADLAQRRIRFIGDPDNRIGEDYLRILRYFRFLAQYGRGGPDPSALAACIRGRDGLKRISAERVRAELFKLIVADGANAAIYAMMDCGLLTPILGAAPRPGLLRAIVDAEQKLDHVADATLRLSALACGVDEDVERLADRLRLSGAERAALIVMDERSAQTRQEFRGVRLRKRLYRDGVARTRRLVVVSTGLGIIDHEAARTTLMACRDDNIPIFPARGADVLAHGVTPGPAVGKALAELEAWWLESNMPDVDAVRARLAEITARR